MTRIQPHPLAAFAGHQRWDDSQLNAYAETIAALYRDGLSTHRIAERLGLASHSTIARHLHALGVDMRRPGKVRRRQRGTCPRCGREALPGRRYCGAVCYAACRRKHPEPQPRACELDGCEIVFLPAAEKVARGAGRFHSYASWNQWRRGKPQRE
jgi:hypothetical protein